jgi:hypothetical protein
MALFPKKDDPISSGTAKPETEPASSRDMTTIENHSIAVPVKQGEKRQHKATYARDKKSGGYLIRVEGPHASAFAGKIVPVVRRDDSENSEALDTLIWAGKDEETGKPVALYRFVQKPRHDVEPEF